MLVEHCGIVQLRGSFGRLQNLQLQAVFKEKRAAGQSVGGPCGDVKNWTSWGGGDNALCRLDNWETAVWILRLRGGFLFVLMR